MHFNHMKLFRILFFCTLMAVTILTDTAYSEFVSEKISVSGITEPIADIELSLEIPGKISTIFFKEGAFVEKAEKILELESDLEALEIKRRQLIWENKSGLNAAAEKEKTLQSLYQSAFLLYEKTKSVSKDELTKLKLEYKLAQAEKCGFEIQEKREEIEYNMALESMNQRCLRSPFRGFIIEWLFDEGEHCEPGQPVARIVSTETCYFVCNVEEKIAHYLTKDKTINLSIQAGADTISKTGVIKFVSPVVDSASGLLKVKVEFENRDGIVRPGVPGTLTIGFSE